MASTSGSLVPAERACEETSATEEVLLDFLAYLKETNHEDYVRVEHSYRAAKEAYDSAEQRRKALLAGMKSYSVPGPERKEFRKTHQKMFEKNSAAWSAQALTQFEFQLFASIPLPELLAGLKPSKCAYTRKMTEHFNEISHWLISSVLLARSERRQAKTITRFIKMLPELLKLNNLSTLAQMTAALSHPALARLKDLWGRVADKHHQQLKWYVQFVSPRNNFHLLRDKLASLQPGAAMIPPLFLIARDLQTMEETLPAWQPSSATLCWASYQPFARQVLLTQRLQGNPYRLPTPLSDGLRAFLSDPLPRMSEERIWEVSASLLPLPSSLAPAESSSHAEAAAASRVCTNPLRSLHISDSSHSLPLQRHSLSSISPLSSSPSSKATLSSSPSSRSILSSSSSFSFSSFSAFSSSSASLSSSPTASLSSPLPHQQPHHHFS